MTFPDSFVLLQQEAFLVRTSLAQGLTLLRNADIGEKGSHYGAFFGLSIGLERLLKVILILDHMARNGLVTPTTAVVRKHGHDLRSLLSSARAVTSHSVRHPIDAIGAGSIENDIVVHLSDFADACGRYANLDALTSGRRGSDPLGNWKRILVRIIDEDVPRRAKEKALAQGSALANAMQGAARVIAHDLDSAPMSLHDWFVLPQLQELAARRAVARTFGILCPVKALLEETNDRVTIETQRQGLQVPVVPFLPEFFDFVSNEPQNLRKKKWP